MTKIPDFKSLEEAADYWDTHSFADHVEETVPVEIEVHLPQRKIRLVIDRDLQYRLKRIAQKKRQSYGKLINAWIREKIMQETAH